MPTFSLPLSLSFIVHMVIISVAWVLGSVKKNLAEKEILMAPTRNYLSGRSKNQIIFWSEFITSIVILLIVTLVVGGSFVWLTYLSFNDRYSNWRLAASAATQIDWQPVIVFIKDKTTPAAAFNDLINNTISQCRLHSWH